MLVSPACLSLKQFDLKWVPLKEIPPKAPPPISGLHTLMKAPSVLGALATCPSKWEAVRLRSPQHIVTSDLAAPRASPCHTEYSLPNQFGSLEWSWWMTIFPPMPFFIENHTYSNECTLTKNYKSVPFQTYRSLALRFKPHVNANEGFKGLYCSILRNHDGEGELKKA